MKKRGVPIIFSSTKKFFISFLFLTMIISVFAGCKKTPPEPITLKIWGLWDDESTIDATIKDFEDSHQNAQYQFQQGKKTVTKSFQVKIEYEKKDISTYESESASALASNTGPDIWLIRNDWMPKQRDKLVALPSSLTRSKSYAETFNLIGDETKWKAPKKELSDIEVLQNYNNTFFDVAYQDNTDQNKVYGLPLSIDTLALYYNKNNLSDAGVSAPKTWNELTDSISKLTQKKGNSIDHAAVALGTAKNIDRASDIFAMLLYQNGVPIISSTESRALFNDPKTEPGGNVSVPGQEVLNFYTSFSNSSSPNYTWNNDIPKDLDAFIDGKTAMIIGYSYLVPEITRRASFGWDISAVPQQKDKSEKNLAQYWVYTVTNSSQYPQIAWDFLLNLTNKQHSQQYLEKTKKPPARQDLVNQESFNSVFNKQLANATSWPKKEPETFEKIFRDMIDSVADGVQTSDISMPTAAKEITDILSKSQ